MKHELVTVTFSPAIDKSTSVPSLIPEKKLHCTAPKLEPGGGGINVARAMIRLGGNAIAIYPSGGYTGKYLDHLMQHENVPFITIQTNNETRENIVVFEESTSKQYRFGMPAIPLTEKDWQLCLQAIADIDSLKILVVSGSMPPGMPEDLFEHLSRIAKEKNAKLIVDTSGTALQLAAQAGVFMLKPNLNELATLAGVDWIEPDHVEEIAKKVIDQRVCEVLVVSLGENGAMLVTKTETHRIKSPQVEKKSTVGAGDSMVAGIIHHMTQGSDWKDVLYYGVACGTAATLNPGTELCHKKDADALYERMYMLS